MPRLIAAAAMLSAMLAGLLAAAQAADHLPGVSFTHDDWELACDNTRTCRAAGYHADDDEQKLSLLLTRKAGPGQQVTGDLAFGELDDAELISKLPPGAKFALMIDGRVVGQTILRQPGAAIRLAPEQVVFLLTALRKSSKIEWANGKNLWRLSDKGVAAVFLKMDEFQGRLGTTGALLKPGAKGEEKVVLPLPPPEFFAAPLAKPQPTDRALVAELSGSKSKLLRAALRASFSGEENCDDFVDDKAGEVALEISRLSQTKLLVSSACWRAAYNTGDGYWVINEAAPFEPAFVTDAGVEYAHGVISASQRGRGIGDCISSDAWTWDGKRFNHSSSVSTGMCKLIAAGGPWALPRLVTNVRPAPR